MSKHIHNLLCLGDSYTAGEGVPLHQGFPYQALQLMRKAGIQMHAPEIVAQTGWTTFELAEHLIHHSFEQHYDFVTLLIGVNNQYRGLPVADFAEDYAFLLRKAINLCVHKEKQVLAISIPDWGITPFAQSKDTTKIAAQIDAYNATASSLAAASNVAWIDMASAYRSMGAETKMLAPDGLHPSGLIYENWATIIADKLLATTH